MRSAAFIVCMLAIIPVFAGEAAKPAGPEAPRGGKPVPAKRLTAMELIAEEEKWTFRAPINRPDVFIDLEALLVAQHQAKIQASESVKRAVVTGKPGEQPQGSDIDKLIAWGRSEEERVRQLVSSRRFDEAMKSSDSALKVLEPHLARPEVSPIIVSIRTYRAQAEEAKVRDDAQAAFEALKIRVLGVLWSQDGLRMAIVEGENRALSVNDRVKDCALINIDQDRVDFRFVFGRRRFEFPVYVDQSDRAKPQAARSKP